MAAGVAQKIDVVEGRKPIRVVLHDRILLAFAEAQEFGEDALIPSLLAAIVSRGSN